MIKYIDAEKLKAEIERQIEEEKNNLTEETNLYYGTRQQVRSTILRIIDSLQQEQSKVDLGKEIATWIPSHITGGEEGVWKECREAVTKWAGIVARHFYELGLNARKEE